MSYLEKQVSACQTTSSEKKETEAKEQAGKIYTCLKQKTKQPIVRFDLEKRPVGIFESKIGGAFYVPEDMDAPKNEKTGTPLFLLAQLNFSQIPHLQDFPERGLLQFFIAGDDDVFGLDFDDPASQKAWRLRYIEEVPDERQISTDQIAEPQWSADIYMPFEEGCTYGLTAQQEVQGVTFCDYRIDDCLKKYWPEDADNFYDLPEDVSEELWELAEEFPCQIGGYPTFTQVDPREDIKPGDQPPELLLFQLDSAEDIMWGDMGVANFFIRREELKEKDFSKAWYNWDCC